MGSDDVHQQLIGRIMRISGRASFNQVNDELDEISRMLGFDGFYYYGRFYTGSTRYIEQVESNYSAAWHERYEKQHYAQIDPIVHHAQHSLCPLVWTDELFQTECQRRFRCEARAHGLAEGITLPVHGRNGDVAFLSLAVSRSDDDARRHVRDMLNWGSLLATFTHEAMRLIVKTQRMTPAPRLTTRETEVLHLVAGGKSTWEISRLLNISEHGVSHHVRNVLVKFDVGSRHQAVAKAVAFGLL
jgi:LuxR family quorum-sensing transcriptional regulator LasR